MRESLEFRLPFGGPKVRCRGSAARRWRRRRLKTRSARHCESGRLPAGCVARGGTAYWSTAMSVRLRLGDGVAVFSEEVLLIVHSRMPLLVPSSEKTARELRKYSLPPLEVSN